MVILAYTIAFCIIDSWQFCYIVLCTSTNLCTEDSIPDTRLYVPYAFGALYNDPVEGFLLDTLELVLLHWLQDYRTVNLYFCTPCHFEDC